MESTKMQMTRRQFRIGDLAKELKVKKFVIRFWEKEFNLKSDRSQGGQRFYTSDDLNIFLAIKDLLYNQGFTIAGAKKQLPEVLAGAKLAPDDSFQDITHNAQEVIEDKLLLTDNFEMCDEELDDELEEELEFKLDELQNFSKDKEIDCEAHIVQNEITPSDVIQQFKHVVEMAQVDLGSQEKSEQVSHKTMPTQLPKEICVPAQAVPDSSFYEGLATLKDQLMRLYELLD